METKRGVSEIETDWLESNNLMTAVSDLLMELSMRGNLSNVENSTMDTITGFLYSESKKAGSLFYELLDLYTNEKAKGVNHD